MRTLMKRAEGIRWRNRGSTFGARFCADLAAEGSPPESELERYFDGHLDGPGIWKWRHYFPAYDRHLGRFVGKPVRLLEIGIFSGGSLGMWRHFLGDQAAIVGVDIEESCRVYARPGIEVVIGDQSDPNFWKQFLAGQDSFDIVIDDGGHETHQQVVTLEAVLPTMSPGGVYVCEDIHGERNGFADYALGLLRNINAVEAGTGMAIIDGYDVTASPFQQAILSAHLYPFLTIIERRDHHLDYLVAPKHGSVWEPYLGGGPSIDD